MAPGIVLTAASTITCSPGHLGAGRITIHPSRRFTVAGQGVLTFRSAATASIAGCTHGPAASGLVPCAAVTVSGGAASKLWVDGSPVLLAATFTAVTTGVPPAMAPPPAPPPPGPPPVGPPPPPPPVPLTVTEPQILLRAE